MCSGILEDEDLIDCICRVVCFCTFLYIFVISADFSVFSRHVRNAGHGAHGGDGPRWHGGVPSFDAKVWHSENTFAEYTVDEVVSRRMMFSMFSHLQGLQVQPRKLRVWSGDVSKRLHLNFCHNILSHLVEWIVQNEYSNRTNALRGMRFDWRCRLAWRLDGNGVYMQTYSTLLVPFLALTSKPLEIALDGLVQQVSRAKFRRTTRYLHVSSICRISMEFCLFPSSHCGRQKPNEAHRSTTRSNFYSTSTTFVVPNGSKWIHMKNS